MEEALTSIYDITRKSTLGGQMERKKARRECSASPVEETFGSMPTQLISSVIVSLSSASDRVQAVRERFSSPSGCMEVSSKGKDLFVARGGLRPNAVAEYKAVPKLQVHEHNITCIGYGENYASHRQSQSKI